MKKEMEARQMRLTGTQEYQYRATDMKVPGSVYVRSNQLQGTEITDEQVREHLRQLGEAVSALHQRLQGSPLGPPPLSLWGRRRP